MYWRRTHPKSHPRNLVKSDASAPLNKVGEFFESLRQCSPSELFLCAVVGFSHLKANRGWLLGTSWRQKVSFKSRHVNHSALEGMIPSSVFGLDCAAG